MLIAGITETWLITMDAPPRVLESDLAMCRRWFDPVAQGQRLRRELNALPPAPTGFPNPGEPLVLAVGGGRRLVTPEGRCALDLLLNLPSGQQRHDFGDSQLLPYDRLLGALYRDWSRHRIQSVVDLLAGTTKPLQIPAAGVVIALLVDRCTSEDRALLRDGSGSGRNVVELAFFNAVNAFADVLAPSRRGKRDQRLVSGWMLYEARRRLGENLIVLDARGGQAGKVWVKPGSEDDVINVVARDVVRGHRARATPERFAEAFDALVEELRLDLPKLAGFGMAHERPANTQRLRTRLIEALGDYLAQGDDASRLAL
jgi:hypothetical protein